MRILLVCLFLINALYAMQTGQISNSTKEQEISNQDLELIKWTIRAAKITFLRSLLPKAKPHINKKNCEGGRTLLTYSIYNLCTAMLRGLHGGKAIAANRMEVFKEILDAGADPNCIDGERCTPLMAVARCGDNDIEIMKMLLQAGARPEASALFVAAQYSKFGIELLLDAGLNVDTLDSEGCSPLMRATFFSRIDIIKILLQRKANLQIQCAVDTPDYAGDRYRIFKGERALDIAQRIAKSEPAHKKYHDSIIQVLQDATTKKSNISE